MRYINPEILIKLYNKIKDNSMKEFIRKDFVKDSYVSRKSIDLYLSILIRMGLIRKIKSQDKTVRVNIWVYKLGGRI